MAHPMSPFPFLLPLILCLALLPLLVLAHENGGAALIQQTCQKAAKRDLCVSLLQSDPDNLKTDLKGLAFAMLQLAGKNATDGSEHIKQFLRQTNLTPAVQQALVDCNEQYVDAIAQIDDAVAALSLGIFGDVYTWVKTAITDIETCEEGVQRESGRALEVSHKNIMVHEMFDICLSVVHVLAHDS